MGINIEKTPRWLRVLIPAVLITTWFVVAGFGGPYFGRISEVSSIDLAAFLPKSSESTKVNEELEKFRDSNSIPALIVFEAKDHELSDTDVERIDATAEKVAKVEGIDGDVSPALRAEDKKAAFIAVPINSDMDIPHVLKDVRKVLDTEDTGNSRYMVTGPAGFSADLNKAFAGIDGILLIVALSVVFVILVIVYRSILLPIIVLMTSMFALTASILLVFWLASQDIIQINGQVQGILFILVIGAATDYSLLYVSRYREALYNYKSTWRATHDALKGALEPIIASGSTVIVGLLCLLLSELGSNRALGPVGAIGIVMAMLSALTFLPVILYALGRASFWPARPIASKEALAKHKAQLKRGFWHKVGQMVDKQRRPVWLATLVLLLVGAAFVPQLKADGIAQDELIIGSSEARDGQDLLAKHFPAGSGSPALVLVGADEIEKTSRIAETVKGVDTTSAIATGTDSGFMPLGKQRAEIRDEIRAEIQKETDKQRDEITAQYGPFADQILASMPSVDELTDKAYPFNDAAARVVDGKSMVQVTLADDPNSEKAKETIQQLREKLHSQMPNSLVGGTTAIQLDTNDASLRDRAVIIPIVLAAITVILMLLLRSVVAPILLLFTTVLSFATALGVAALVFNHIWEFPGAEPSVILYAFVFLVALGIDYNIFLMTRVREETVKHGTREGVIRGLVVTGGVITSAGVVLASTFAALVVIPIVFLFQLAFIVAFGVLLDTFIVRSLLVPALIRDSGPWVWWPSKLRHKK